jgi:hypothetical protein
VAGEGKRLPNLANSSHIGKQPCPSARFPNCIAISRIAPRHRWRPAGPRIADLAYGSNSEFALCTWQAKRGKGTITRQNLHVLCYQHQREMPPKLRSESTEPLFYVCPAPGCPIRYESSGGYIIETADKEAVEQEILPRVRCPSDERPMYLAKVEAERRSFRLWKCPECGSTRTNEGSSGEVGKKMGA